MPAPVNTSWNSLLTFTSKKDKKGDSTLKRPCQDPRSINKLLPDYRFPLSLIRDVFQRMQGAEVLATLDLKSTFHRCKIYEPHRHKTTFTVDGKQYMFAACPFWLKAISSKFQRVMNILFDDLPCVSCFVDDVVVFSKNINEHISHVKELIKRLTDAKLILNAKKKKCHFVQKPVSLLDFTVNAQGVTLYNRKITNVQDWLRPRTGKDVQRLPGLVNYFKGHIPKIAELIVFRQIKKCRRFIHYMEQWAYESFWEHQNSINLCSYTISPWCEQTFLRCYWC